jgi:hypothetical protein
MVDKVKVAVLQRNDTEIGYQEEANISSDYIAGKGFSFNGLDSHLIEKTGGVVRSIHPDYSYKPTYSAGGDITSYETFNGINQTVANRLARNDLTYTGDKITKEVIKIYDTGDGTTVLRTITIDHTYTDDDLTKSEIGEA